MSLFIYQQVQIPEFKMIKQCRRDIKMLKMLWDYNNIVRTTFEDWKKTKWREIDAELLDNECKKFAKELRLLYLYKNFVILYYWK